MANDLSIFFSKDGFSFFVTKDGDLIYHNKKFYPKDPFLFQSDLLSLMQEHTLYWTQNYDQVNVCFYSSQFNLIPSEVYEAYSEPEFWLEFNTEIFENDPIKNIKIPEHNIVLVYSYASEIEEVLNHYFENFTVEHSFQNLIKKAAPHTGKRMYAHLFFNTLSLLVMHDEQIILYNIFNVNTKEDFSYYILNAYKNTDLNPAQAPLYCLGDDLENYLKMLSNFVSHIEFI